MKVFVTFVAVILTSTIVFSQGSRKILLVSDIDDTIKVSHILSTVGKVSRAANFKTPFTGMAQLYQWIINMNPQTTQLVYLSNAPEEIVGIPAIRISHENFLKYNGFPKGDLILRKDLQNSNHKIQVIRQLIDANKPEVVILVGDNGELDAQIYHQAVSEYAQSGIQMISFVHLLYATNPPVYIPESLAEVGQPIFSEQFGYVTPIEIALELEQQKILSGAAVDWLVKNVMPFIVKESGFKLGVSGPITFPFFSNCSDFQWRWEKTPRLSPLIDKLKSKCN